MINIVRCKTTSGELEHLKRALDYPETADSSDVIIAEDRFTLTIEQELLKAKKGKGSFAARVFSFQRLAHALSVGQAPLKTLTKTGGVMVISKILNDVFAELKCYRQIAKSYSNLSESLYEVIAQLKSSGVSADDLKPELTKSAALSNKISDISRIFRMYEDFKKSEVLDAQDKADLLATLIPNSALIKASKIFVVGFTSFTKQFYTVIGKLFNTAKEVTVYVLDGENDVYDKSVLKTLINTADALSLNYKLTETAPYLTEETAAINNSLFAFLPKNKIKKLATDKVSIEKFPDLFGELKAAAVKILQLVRVENYRFSDVAVISSDLNANAEIISREFAKYGIPAFIDSKINLSSHPLARAAISLMEIADGDNEIDNYFNVLFSPYFDLPYEEKRDFQNYLIKYGVSKRNIRKPLKDAHFNELFDKLKALTPKMPSLDIAKNYADGTLKLVERLNLNSDEVADRFTKTNEAEYAALTKQALNKFKETLDELKSVLGDGVLSLSDYILILKDGLAAKELSIAPLYADQVFVGDYTSSKISAKRALFAITVNSKLVPFVKSDAGLITDRDIDGLIETGVDLEPKIELVNEREKLNVFLALHNFTDKLFISYSDYSVNSEALGISEVVTALTNAFDLPEKKETALDFGSDKNLSEYAFTYLPSYKVAIETAAECFSDNLSNDKKKEPLFSAIYNALQTENDNTLNALFVEANERVEDAFKNKNLFSVSELESYFSCPYKNFVSNALYAKEREVAAIRANDSGNYIHKALQLFMEKFDNLSDTAAKVFAKTTIENIRREEPYATINSHPKFKVAFDKLDNEFYRVTDEIIRRRAKVLYKSVGEEIKFDVSGSVIQLDGENVKMPPFRLSNGVSLHGSVDYADRYGKYLRVIDYKTGHIDSKPDKIYLGQKFQPYIYLAAVCKPLNLIPSAALYFPINPAFSDSDGSPYKMEGFVTDNAEALNGMDANLAVNAQSDIINVRMNKDGSVRKNCAAIPDKSLNALINYSEKLAENATNEIKMGYISPSPYFEACARCSYHGICGYDVSFSGERKEKGKITLDTITEATKND